MSKPRSISALSGASSKINVDQQQSSKYLCAICGKKTTMCCSQCNMVFYCSPEHQKQHWKTHKNDCGKVSSSLKQDYDETPSGKQYQRQQTLKIDNFTLIPDYEAKPDPLSNSQRTIKLKQERSIEKENPQIFAERASLRKEVITYFAVGEYEKSIIPCKRLIQVSKVIFDLTKKRQDFYDYMADELTLVKAYLKIDQVKTARELLTEDSLEMENYIRQAKVIPISAHVGATKDGYELSIREKEEIKSRNDNMNDIRKRCSLVALFASLFYACGDFRSCEKHYVVYVQVIETAFGKDVRKLSLETSNCYFLVGVFYLQHKYFVKSLACFKRSLSIRLSKLGERHESVTDCWYNLGIIYKQTGKKIKAIEFLERTLQLRRELIGDVSLQVAQCLETLGKVYMEDGDFKSALVKFEECYKIRKRILNNEQHSDIVRVSLLIIHLYTLIREQILQQTAPRKTQDMLYGLSDHITTALLDKNLNNYLSMAKSHLDILLLEEKKKEQQRVIGIYDKKTLQQQTLENNARLISSDDYDGKHKSSYSDELDSKNQHQQEDDEDDPQHYLVIEKDLMSTLSLDQLVALQHLYDNLKLKSHNDPSYEPLTDVIRSDFVRSLSHVQFSLLKQKNPNLFKQDNEEIHAFEVARGQSAKILTNVAASMAAPHITQNPYQHAHLLEKQQNLSPQQMQQQQTLSQFLQASTHPHIVPHDPNHPLNQQLRPLGSTVYGSPSPLYPGYNQNNNNLGVSQSQLQFSTMHANQQQNPQYLAQNPNNYQEQNQGEMPRIQVFNASLKNQLPNQQNPNNYNNYENLPDLLKSSTQNQPIYQNPQMPGQQNLNQSVGFGNQQPSNLTGTAVLQPHGQGNQAGTNIMAGTGNFQPQGQGNFQPQGQGNYQPQQGNFHQQNLGPNQNFGQMQQNGVINQFNGQMHNSGQGQNMQNTFQQQPTNVTGNNIQQSENTGKNYPLANQKSDQQQQNNPNQQPQPQPQHNINQSGLHINIPTQSKVLGQIPVQQVQPNAPPQLQGNLPQTPTDTSSVSDTSTNKLVPPAPAVPRPSTPPPPLPRPSMVPKDLGPKSKTKQLQWEKMQSDLEQTVWGEKDLKPAPMKFDDLDEQFAISPSKQERQNHMPIKTETITLINDAKKLGNINIMLSSFKKYSEPQLQQGIINVDPNILTVEACNRLLQTLPEPEEINNCKEFDGKVELLDAPSKFYLMISKIPNYEPRLRNVIFRDELPLQLKSLTQQAYVVQRCCQTIRSSSNFKLFLKIVLDVGNKMNSGTLKGQAQGFKLSSLNQLIQMKSNKGDQTLLQYLIKKLKSENMGDVLKFTEEFDILKDAQNINVEDLKSNLTTQQSSLRKLGVVIEKIQQDGDKEFLQAFGQFYHDSIKDVTECEAQILKAKKDWEDTARFYGEDDDYFKTKTSEDFFKNLYTFNENVKKNEKSTNLQNKYSNPNANANLMPGRL